MRRWLGLFLTLAILAAPAVAEAACDQRISPRVQKQKDGDALVVCSTGEFDFRGYPTKASISADTENPTDSSTVTIQLQSDEGNNLSISSIVDVLIADTSAAGGGLASTAPDTGVSSTASESGNILNERVSDKLMTVETNGSGEAQLLIEHNADNDFWVKVLMATGEILTGPKIDFD